MSMVYKYRPIELEQIKDSVNIADYDNLLLKRRGFCVSPFNKKEGIVLLLSGGLDSVGLWIQLLSKYNLQVFPLYLYSHNLNTAPYRAIQHYASILKSRFPDNFEPVKVWKTSVPLFIYSRLKRNLATKMNINMVLHNLTYNSEKKKHVPIVPNQPSRLGMFVFSAFEYALSLSYQRHDQISKIIYALTPEEDKIRGSELPAIRLFSLLLCELTRDNHWEVLAPIEKQNGFFIKKNQLVGHCEKIGIDLSRSWSCGRSDRYHCGACFNCFHRKKAFHDAGVEDKTKYHDSKLRQIFAWFYWVCQGIWFKSLIRANRHTSPSTFSLIKKMKINPHLQWLKENNKLFLFNEAKGYVDELQGTVVVIWQSLTKKPQSAEELVSKNEHNRKIIISFLRDALKNNYVVFE